MIYSKDYKRKVGKNKVSGLGSASEALGNKLSALSKAQATAEEVQEMSDGTIRYYGKFREAKKIGPSSGSRFVTEYNPQTGDVMMWNEVYNQKGLVNRLNLKNINGIQVNALHFPPTLKETLAEEYSNLYLGRRYY